MTGSALSPAILPTGFDFSSLSARRERKPFFDELIHDKLALASSLFFLSIYYDTPIRRSTFDRTYNISLHHYPIFFWGDFHVHTLHVFVTKKTYDLWDQGWK